MFRPNLPRENSTGALMFEICLFDLDETLIHSNDLKTVREAGKNVQSAEYIRSVNTALAKGVDRRIYSLALLHEIKKTFPDMKLGVFTRSPRSYATAALAWAYPGFQWDVIVAYEDVKRTKPYGDGIDLVLEKFGMYNREGLPRTILVGDGNVDIRSAYHCGCVVALDKSAWPRKFESEHWGAIDHVADAIIEKPEQIIDVLTNPREYLPALERALSGIPAPRRPARFDKLGHFVPPAAGGNNTSYPIFVAGRSFSKYDSVKYRKQWHVLTESIEDNKKSVRFPDAWVKTVRSFIAVHFGMFIGSRRLVVSVVPHRPGREPRLENFLAQLAASIEADPIRGVTVSCQPHLLAYRDGVKSQHGDYLNRDERFINVRDHLFVQQLEHVRAGTAFLIIDDVVTTGASLIYSQKYLQGAGATDVKLLSMAKNVGNLFK